MKRIFLTLLLSAFTFAVFAQIQNEDLAITQAYFQKDKKDLVKSSLKLSEAQSQAFWPLYDQYDAKRLALSNQRAQIINDYLKAFKTLTGDEAVALTNRVFASDKSYLDLKKSYFKKFVAAIGGKNAAKFYQLENYVQEVVRLKIQDNIPFIGEIQKNAKQ
jgi:hypothetical protein